MKTEQQNGLEERAEPMREREDENIAMECDSDDPLSMTTTRRRRRKAARVQRKNNIGKMVRRKKKKAKDATVDESQVPPIIDPAAKARGYQLEILRESLERNTIAFLETGCGKTLIAVLLMRTLAHRLRMSDQKRIAVFLVPTVNLVFQQSRVIDCHTDLKVGEYVGHMGVDTWKPEKWLGEIALHEVLVMTHQIFLDLLTHAILKIDIVEILIFDECHHATKKHPYCKIMNRYRETPLGSRPRIFGMTASPVICKGVSSSADADSQLKALEQQLDAKVYAVKDRTELEAFVPTPKTFNVYYDASTFPTGYYKSKLQAIARKYEAYNGVGANEEENYKDYEELGTKLQKTMKKGYNALAYCLNDLGLWFAHEAAKILLKDVAQAFVWETSMNVVAVLKTAKDSFLKECRDFLKSSIPNGTEGDLSEQVNAGLLTPKVKVLVDVLLKYSDVQDMRCIVFVTRVVTSRVLASLFKQLKCLSFLRCEYLAGVNNPLDHVSHKFQQTTIEKFVAGQLNLLVATNVAEEGLDVQGCHLVIRFDPCTTVRSHIQSRGRARRPGSDYFVFMEVDNAADKAKFSYIVESEVKMTQTALDRLSEMDTPISPPSMPEVESFRVESTGAIITTDSAISFMYRFCSKLPADKYYTPRPEFSFSMDPGGMYVCNLRLPPNSPMALHELTGSARRSQSLAKQVVCLEACKIMHRMGAITDNLLPVVDDAESMDPKTTKNRGAGTRKQMELHNTVILSSLKGSWGDAENGASLHAYKLTFSSESDEKTSYASFAFLVESKLHDDVAQLEVDLALRSGSMATAKFQSAGRVDLTGHQLRNAKEYQELLFNVTILGKLLTRSSKVPGSLSTHKSSVVTSTGKLWDGKRMYLLLPVHRDKEAAEDSPANDLQIDWKSTGETARAARMFKSIYTDGDAGHSTSASEDEGPAGGLATTTWLEPESLQMALGTRINLSDVIDTVVLTVHTGMLFVITKVLKEDARSAFPEYKAEGKESEGTKFTNYCDYFAQKHLRPLKYPDQPLLQARHTRRTRNLLARNSLSTKGKKKRKTNHYGEEAEEGTVELPPELCVVLGVSSSVLESASLVPSVMHRLEAVLTATELQQMIIKGQPQCPHIPVMRIVEALTTARAQEEFSLERLELLGDSFLKEYIQDEVFDPSCWVPPGRQCPRKLLCRCNLANLRHCHSENAVDEKDDKKPSTKVFKTGKSCANGHRWLRSKTISDAVEALIGAYLVEGGAAGALSFMMWAGFLVEVDQAKVESATTRSAVDPRINAGANLQMLESILNYSFANTALLVEGITHVSHQELRGRPFCYQRLEFLGDAVLDLLITKHLFSSHPGLSPGLLTDLRSAAVNNECFARVAVKHKLNKYLRHGSLDLLREIENFVEAYKNSMDNLKDPSYGWDGVKGPKVLGDLVESIAGAILLDSGFDVKTVWRVMKPILSPIVTPQTLCLHPVRELQELCQSRDFGMDWQVMQDDKQYHTVIIDVDIGVEPKLSVTSSHLQTKTAKKEAANQMLGLLEKQGIRHSRKEPMLEKVAEPPKTDGERETAFIPHKRKLDELYQEADRLASFHGYAEDLCKREG